MTLTDRVAIITGGAGVLGGSIASALAEAGAKVAVLGRTREKAERKVAELQAAGADAMAIQADVTNENALRSARETVIAAPQPAEPAGSSPTPVGAAGVTYNQDDATGFLRIQGLPTRVMANVKK